MGKRKQYEFNMKVQPSEKCKNISDEENEKRLEAIFQYFVTEMISRNKKLQNMG